MQERFYHITIPFVFGIIGFIIAVSTMNTAARYVSLCVVSDTWLKSPLTASRQVLNGSELCRFHRDVRLDQ